MPAARSTGETVNRRARDRTAAKNPDAGRHGKRVKRDGATLADSAKTLEVKTDAPLLSYP